MLRLVTLLELVEQGSTSRDQCQFRPDRTPDEVYREEKNEEEGSRREKTGRPNFHLRHAVGPRRDQRRSPSCSKVAGPSKDARAVIEGST